MKLPFYTVIGPHFKRNYYFIRQFCGHPFLCISDFYTMVLGILGVAFSVFDIAMILKCGPTLPGYLLKARGDFGKVIDPTLERDLKLIALLVSLEYYLFLIVGVMSKSPVFFLPFLFLYAFIIVMEFVTLFLRLFTDGFNFNKSSLFTSMFVVYNWMCVFCCFWHKMEYCDY
ncbi:uncharacterized protein LOC123004357 isoform X1 [Tribolium madens]|uniref:uncharacterized protein LOC123004357 isoform X1 n=1 Tax=Tribolium madens TaxID=41895 RepID=UPI001CF72DC0|nr:uncharacterized protein LOC123004357 isoform X1 [Tribolium madens]